MNIKRPCCSGARKYVPGHHPAHTPERKYNNIMLYAYIICLSKRVHITKKWDSVRAHIILLYGINIHIITIIIIITLLWVRCAVLWCVYVLSFVPLGVLIILGIIIYLCFFFRHRRRCSCVSSSQVFFVTGHASTVLEQLLVNTSTTVTGHDPFPAR